MNRRVFVTGLGAVLAVPVVAGAQQTEKVYGIGVLMSGARPTSSSASTMASILPLALRDLGYEEGKNLVVEQRFAEVKLDQLPGLARELVPRRIDILIAVSPVAVQAAKDATK